MIVSEGSFQLSQQQHFIVYMLIMLQLILVSIYVACQRNLLLSAQLDTLTPSPRDSALHAASIDNITAKRRWASSVIPPDTVQTHKILTGVTSTESLLSKVTLCSCCCFFSSLNQIKAK